MIFKKGSVDLVKLNNDKKKDIIKRILIALIFVPLVIFGIAGDTYDKGITLLVIVCVFASLGGIEILSFGKSKELTVYPVITVIITIGMNVMAYLCSTKIVTMDYFPIVLLIILFGSFVVFIIQLFSHNFEKTLEVITLNIFSFIYPGLLCSFIILVKYEFGFWYLISFFLISWGGDGGAYFVGTLLGRTKLNIPPSPNKTLEGYIGGIIAAVSSSLIVTKLIAPQAFTGIIYKILPLEIAITFFLSFVSFAGDLLESAIKRSAGKKDSYKFLRLAGHGGSLDIIDSVIFIFPIGYFILKLFYFIF